jgi:DNA repair exonuclease SbcCD ATPase subunit
MIEGLQSQEKYLDDYKNNIETVKNAGLSDALVTALADGSKESADNLQVIVDKLAELGEGSQEAKDLITTLNEEFAKVVESKQTLEDTLVQMNGTLKQQTEELVNTMQTAVDDMNLSDDAAASAKATLEAYAENIRTSGGDAVSAAQEIASQVSQALSQAKADMAELKSIASEASNIKVNPNNPNQMTKAQGDTFTPDTFIAGEAGAELITNHLGSEVFPASETAKIIRAVREFDNDVPEMPSEVRESTTTEQIQTITTRSTKDVNLNINGQGMNMQGGLSMDAVESFLSENIRPVLLNILSQEAMEEGDMSYEY